MNFILRTFFKDLRKISFREHLFYWLLPLLILIILITFYFSGIPSLVQLICPKENWEWGILENLQLVIISGMIYLSVYAAYNKKHPFQKWGFGLIGILASFILLEEMDYGAHFAQLIGGEKEVLLKQYIPHNIHNLGNNAKLFKRTVILIMAIIFVIAPFIKPYAKNPYLRYLIPKPRIVIISLLTILADLIPRALVTFNILKDGGLGVNINEFGELMVYYIFLIYMVQLIFSKNLETEDKLILSQE